MCMYIYIYIEREREIEREGESVDIRPSELLLGFRVFPLHDVYMYIYMAVLGLASQLRSRKRELCAAPTRCIRTTLGPRPR